MLSLPIPDKSSPIRYSDLTWRGRNLGELVAQLTRGKQRSDYRAHLDPDLRESICSRKPGWSPSLGQHGTAQGHLRNQGVGIGDVFLFWGSFQNVDAELRRVGCPEHHIWGWLQVKAVVSVDDVVRKEGKDWGWARAHPHFAFSPDPTNTLYIASERLSLPGENLAATPGFGVFEQVAKARRLTAPDAASPSEWALPSGFLPKGRAPLSYHTAENRWSRSGRRARLQAVSRGQEFVLDLELYPELMHWIAEIIAGSAKS